jgi:hypothetical protein
LAQSGQPAYGDTNGYGFGDNGEWFGDPPMIGLNASAGQMIFAFDTPVSAVGGILNWDCCFISNPNWPSAEIAVFDSNGVLIEDLFLSSGSTTNVLAPNTFYGFSESTADISYFVLYNDVIGIRDLTVATTPIPAALPLFATGLGGLGLLGWRRKRKAQGVA